MLSQAYPRGGDSVTLRALSPRDCQREFCFFYLQKLFSHLFYTEWIQEIDHASKRARRAEERVSQKLRR